MGITAFLQNVTDLVVIARTAFNSAVTGRPEYGLGMERRMYRAGKTGAKYYPKSHGPELIFSVSPAGYHILNYACCARTCSAASRNSRSSGPPSSNCGSDGS
jgi:hypothetical protein